MAWAAAAVFVILALPNVVKAEEDHMLDSVLVIGSETGESGRSTCCSMQLDVSRGLQHFATMDLLHLR